MRRSLQVAALSVLVFAINATVALAGAKPSATPVAGDPTQIGNNVKDIVSPNAKAAWWVILIAGLLAMAATRKAGRAIATGIFLIVAGVAVYNPGGVTTMMGGIAQRVL